MHTIGLIGGLSWESTVIYYQIINQRVRERLGGSHSANSLIWSVDYTRVEELIFAGRWDEVSALLADAGGKLEGMGAEMLLVCSNTFNRVADDVARAASVPVLHIADAVGAEVRARGWRRVGLLGTRFTMEEPRLAGLTNIGRSSGFTMLQGSVVVRHSCWVNHTCGVTGMSSARNARRVAALSMATAEAKTPQPTYGRPSVARCP